MHMLSLIPSVPQCQVQPSSETIPLTRSHCTPEKAGVQITNHHDVLVPRGCVVLVPYSLQLHPIKSAAASHLRTAD